MAGEDGTSANIESLNAALAEAEIKAATGDNMYSVRAKFLRDKLAAITMPSQQPEAPDLPQSLRMTALNTAHTEAKQNYKPEKESTQKNLEGSTQVTVVSDVPSDNCPTNVSGSLAGASPHAPRQPDTKQKGDRFSFRMPEGMKPMLEAKAAAVKSYPSAYILGLIAADLRIPIDEAALQRDRMLGDEIAALTLELTRQGTNFNQLTKATHEGKPCALARPQISELLRQNTTAVNAILRLGFSP